MDRITNNFTNLNRATRLDAFAACEAINDLLEQTPPNLDNCLRSITTIYVFARENNYDEINQLAYLIERTVLSIRAGNRIWTKQLQIRLQSYCGLLASWLNDPDCGSGQQVSETPSEKNPAIQKPPEPAERIWNLIAQLTVAKFKKGEITLPE